MAEEEIILVLGVILIILLIAYGIFLWYSYQNKTFIFDYKPPPLKGGYRPGGTPKQLTPAQQQARKNALTNGTIPSNNPCNGNSGQ